jgi:hypothetical protein
MGIAAAQSAFPPVARLALEKEKVDVHFMGAELIP